MTAARLGASLGEWRQSPTPRFASTPTATVTGRLSFRKRIHRRPPSSAGRSTRPAASPTAMPGTRNRASSSSATPTTASLTTSSSAAAEPNRAPGSGAKSPAAVLTAAESRLGGGRRWPLRPPMAQPPGGGALRIRCSRAASASARVRMRSSVRRMVRNPACSVPVACAPSDAPVGKTDGDELAPGEVMLPCWRAATAAIAASKLWRFLRLYMRKLQRPPGSPHFTAAVFTLP